MQESNLLLREDADGVATLTMNRPDQLNALSEEPLAELGSACSRVCAMPAI